MEDEGPPKSMVEARVGGFHFLLGMVCMELAVVDVAAGSWVTGAGVFEVSVVEGLELFDEPVVFGEVCAAVELD